MFFTYILFLYFFQILNITDYLNNHNFIFLVFISSKDTPSKISLSNNIETILQIKIGNHFHLAYFNLVTYLN